MISVNPVGVPNQGKAGNVDPRSMYPSYSKGVFPSRSGQIPHYAQGPPLPGSRSTRSLLIRGSHCLFVVLSEFSSITLFYSRPTRDEADIFRVAVKATQTQTSLSWSVPSDIYSPFKLFPLNPRACFFCFWNTCRLGRLLQGTQQRESRDFKIYSSTVPWQLRAGPFKRKSPGTSPQVPC